MVKNLLKGVMRFIIVIIYMMSIYVLKTNNSKRTVSEVELKKTEVNKVGLFTVLVSHCLH